MERSVWFVFIFTLSIALVPGCGNTPTPPSYGSEDGKKIAELIADFNDSMADVKKFQTIFIIKPAKTNKEYGRYMYDVSGSPSVSGEQATAKIKVTQDNGKDKGVVDWTFVKQGDKWKIKEAPLP
jgi:hypothetical protein